MVGIGDVVEHMGSMWIVEKLNENSAIVHLPERGHEKRCLSLKGLVVVQKSGKPQESLKPTMKLCRDCNEIKPLSEYRRFRGGAFLSICMDCYTDRQKVGREKAKKTKEQQAKEEIKSVALQDKIKTISNEVVELVEQKNHDYGNSYLETVGDFGLVAGVIPIWNKSKRLKSLVSNKAQVKESISDTLMDLIGYSLLLLTELENIDGKNE